MTKCLGERSIKDADKLSLLILSQISSKTSQNEVAVDRDTRSAFTSDLRGKKIRFGKNGPVLFRNSDGSDELLFFLAGVAFDCFREAPRRDFDDHVLRSQEVQIYSYVGSA